jgi:hypothetical protein
LYLYFAKHQIPCLNKQNDSNTGAVQKISLKTGELLGRFIRAFLGVQFLHFFVYSESLFGMERSARKLFYSSPM